MTRILLELTSLICCTKHLVLTDQIDRIRMTRMLLELDRLIGYTELVLNDWFDGLHETQSLLELNMVVIHETRLSTVIAGCMIPGLYASGLYLRDPSIGRRITGGVCWTSRNGYSVGGLFILLLTS